MPLKPTLSAALVALTAAPFATAAPDFTFDAGDAPESGDVVIYLASEGTLGEGADAVDTATDGRLSTALEMEGFDGSFGKHLALRAMAPFNTITVIGAGSAPLSARQLADLGGHAAMANDGDALTILTEGLPTEVEGAGAHIAKGYGLRSYTFTKYRSTEPAPDYTVRVHGSGDSSQSLFESELAHLLEGVSLARDLGTEPGNTLWPAEFVARVRTAFSGVGNIRLRVLDAEDIQNEGMGALMGVGQGSIHDPRLLVVEYNGGARNEAPIALVGKGITFDTGGISLKQNDGMWYMKSDLSGAAAVAGAVLSAAKREEAVNVVGVMPLAENMPSQDAIRPGDVLTTMSGKTIEIMSTDAEGRLILADAVTFAQEEYSPRLLVNIATLTGSAARAAGDEYGVVITREMDLSLEMMDIGEAAGEDVWPLPLHPNHFDQIRSPIADIKNTGGAPGASIGAAVVGTFIAEDVPWVHLDIAGVDWLEAGTPTTPPGHAGWGVRFMDQMLRQEAE